MLRAVFSLPPILDLHQGISEDLLNRCFHVFRRKVLEWPDDANTRRKSAMDPIGETLAAFSRKKKGV